MVADRGSRRYPVLARNSFFWAAPVKAPRGYYETKRLSNAASARAKSSSVSTPMVSPGASAT
jgi:hypothetical protein